MKVSTVKNLKITDGDIASISTEFELSFDSKRTDILKSMESIDVQACPGSGKTTLIATKLILLAQKWTFSGQGICVLTHTNVAKDEIIERLKKSKIEEAQKLLSYPHFIGTIQEFVGRFLVIPFIHSDKIDRVVVDDEVYVYLFERHLERFENSWIKGSLNGLGSDNIPSFISNTYYSSTGDINLSMRTKDWKKNSSNEERAKDKLQAIKEKINQGGYYLYRDIFMQSYTILDGNKKLADTVQKRFPFVFIDEMQDTQEHQDDVLQKVFSSDNAEIIIQRFGDPDQAIFNGNSGESNKTFNNRTDLDFVIDNSHRFDSTISNKIKPLSINQIDLSSNISEEKQNTRLGGVCKNQSFKHSIILYDNDTIGDVIEKFGDIVSEQFNDDYQKAKNFTVKALGAVGKAIEKEKDLRIPSYCNSYDNKKSGSTPKFNNFIEVVRYVRQMSTVDFLNKYKIFMEGIIKLLRLTKEKDESDNLFYKKSLQSHLKENGEWDDFQKWTYDCLNNNEDINEKKWEQMLGEIKAISIFAREHEYMQYTEAPQIQKIQSDASSKMELLPQNTIRHPKGFDIHLSTIHGVKGETHDATLILETKNQITNLNAMLPYITKDFPNKQHPHSEMPEEPHHKRIYKPNKLFSRQLYVASSRPRYLLCLAMHKKHITKEQREKLTSLGWRIQDLLK